MKTFLAVSLFAICVVGVGVEAAERPLPQAAPESLGISSDALARIDEAVKEALARKDMPGAVVVVVHRGKVIFRKAYGERSLRPEKTAMTPEVIFDLASLTKPIATAAAILLLIEQGKLKASDPLAKHLPKFARKETEGITLEHLLLHTSGFIPDNAIADYRDGPAKAVERLQALKPVSALGSKFSYSDVNYILLGQVVEKVSGMTLDQFTKKHIYDPLGMNETGFRPQGKLKERCAPTEQRDGRWMVGEVHDPRAAALGGVAGHAGLFASADDLAVFAQMLLNGGEYGGKRVFKAETVRQMTDPHEVPKGKRTYGWDMATAYSSNRGSVFPSGKSYGHTGFTGTSIWIDPGSATAVIVLGNRVHPDGKGNATKLRGQVATITGGAVLKLEKEDPISIDRRIIMTGVLR